MLYYKISFEERRSRTVKEVTPAWKLEGFSRIYVENGGKYKIEVDLSHFRNNSKFNATKTGQIYVEYLITNENPTLEYSKLGETRLIEMNLSQPDLNLIRLGRSSGEKWRFLTIQVAIFALLLLLQNVYTENHIY